MTTAPTTNLQPGSTNKVAVAQLQNYLVENGYMTQAEMDTGAGIYGTKTQAAVAKMQTALGVNTSGGGSGYYGPITQAKIAAKQSTPTVSSVSSSAQTVLNNIKSSLANGDITPAQAQTMIAQVQPIVAQLASAQTSSSPAKTGSWMDILGVPQYGGYNMTLQQIADKYGVSVQDFIAANPKFKGTSPGTVLSLDAYRDNPGLLAAVGMNTPTKGQGTPSAQNNARDINGLLVNPSDAQFDRNTGNPIAQSATGSPMFDKLLETLNRFIEQQLTNGNKVNPDLQITPDLVSKFLQEAHTQVDPWSQQQLTNEITNINANLGNIGKNYVYEQGGLQQKFQNDLAQERNAAGNAGTAFSGGRGLIEQNMLAAQNRSLGELDTRYASNIGNVLRTGATTVGNNPLGLTGTTDNFNLPSLTPQTASLEGARGGVAGGNALDFNYTPGNYQIGSLGSQYGSNLTAQSNQFLSDYLKSAGNNSARSFQNLSGTPTYPGLT